MIKVVNLYVDEDEDGNQKRITAEEPIDGSTPTYDGHAVVGIETPMGMMERPLTFPIPGAKNVEEAFEKFDEAKKVEGPIAAKRMIQDMKEQMMEQQERQRSKIIVPGANVNVPIPPDARG